MALLFREEQPRTTLSISLPDAIQEFVEEAVIAGGCPTPDAYFLTLLQAARRQHEEGKKAVEHGVEQIEQGCFTEYTSGDEAADSLIAEGLKRAAAQGQKSA